jgi:hypothetical protein
MSRLYCILEEAETIINQDDMPFHVEERPLKYPSRSSTICSLPSLSDIKPFAHKVNKSAKKHGWKKPKDKPKRPLSAYNLFFQHERKKIITALPEVESAKNDGLTQDQRRRMHRTTHGKIGFGDLARNIAQNWKTIDNSTKSIFSGWADAEKARYKNELDAWQKAQTDNGERTKTENKKKTILSVSKSRSKSLAQSLKNPEETAAQPEPLTPLLASNYCTERAQLVQCMVNNQALLQFQQQNKHDVNVYEGLSQFQQDKMNYASVYEASAQFQQQKMNDANVYDVLMAKCSDHRLHRQRENLEQHRRLSQPNNLYVNSVPQTNQLHHMGDLRCAIPFETFLKESFFEDVEDEESFY